MYAGVTNITKAFSVAVGTTGPIVRITLATCRAGLEDNHPEYPNKMISHWYFLLSWKLSHTNEATERQWWLSACSLTRSDKKRRGKSL